MVAQRSCLLWLWALGQGARKNRGQTKVIILFLGHWAQIQTVLNNDRH